MKKSINDQYEIEKQRNILASKSLYKELVLTYSKNFPEVKDLNTNKLWDKLNREVTISKKNNPMAWDRYNIILNWISKGRILDVGFGQAILEKIALSKAYSNSFEWFGLDISSASVKEASKRYRNAKFTVGSIIQLPYKNNYFDYVVTSEVLEHIVPSRTFQALGEIFRVTKKGGKAIVSVPLGEDLKSMILKNENYNAHVRQYTPDLIKAEVQISGFKLVDEKLLYAFINNYLIKSFIANYIIQGIRKPNNIVILARKP